ncbi:MAG: ABC transporter substrate-binding protein [Rhodospirillales bacterium]|nr:ABC transporter substrate-binding protein [Rhodospirillales bacterium]
MNMRPHRLTAIVLAILLSLSAGGLPSHPAAAATASELISAFHGSLLGVMKEAKALGVKGRYERLASPVERSFNLPLMIQVAAGSYWQQAGPEQIGKLVAAFTRLSIGTYASKFDGFSGESFETRGEKPGPQNTTLVSTRIVKASGSPVEIVYVTRQTKGEWRIVDVLVDNGISELAVRRSEYRAILQSGGVDGLIATLNAKTDQLLNEKPK